MVPTSFTHDKEVITTALELGMILTTFGNLKFIHIRDAGALLALEDSAIAGYARMQMNWHNRHQFCSVCGSSTIMTRAGQVRKCTQCPIEHFPRTDPVIIVIVHDGERCLLGQSRGRLQNTNTYSALAGFVDQGESQ